jgi:predicted enzyme related to lactoylglutathione lyase
MSTVEQLVTGVDFAPVPVRDLDRAVDFYGTALGLRRSVYRPDRGFAEFETGNLTLSLVNFEGMGMEHHPNPNALALHVEDIEEARARLEAAGVSFLGDTFDTGVCHMAFFSDPDGNALMFHHRYAPRTTEAAG